MPANQIFRACALAIGLIVAAGSAEGQVPQTRVLASLRPETLAAYRRAVDLCSDFGHANYLTPDEAAAAGVTMGFTRGPGIPLTEDHLAASEVLGLRTPQVQIHVRVYDMPTGRRSVCSLFLFGVDNATFQALLADYITRTERRFASGDWRAWSRSTGETFIRYFRTNAFTESELYAVTIAGGPQTLNFTRNDPKDMPLDAFDDW